MLAKQKAGAPRVKTSVPANTIKICCALAGLVGHSDLLRLLPRALGSLQQLLCPQPRPSLRIHTSFLATGLLSEVRTERVLRRSPRAHRQWRSPPRRPRPEAFLFKRILTPKDFRTWAGTLIAAVKLAQLGITEDPAQADKNVLAAVKEVAKRLGNTREIARASYVSPRVIDHYLEGSVIAYYGELVEEVIAEQEGLTEGEEALLKLLNKKLRHELRKAA